MEEFYRVHLSGTLNLLEALREEAPNAAVLLVSSTYAYGRIDGPILETTSLNPVTYYGVSKAPVDMLGLHLRARRAVAVLTKPFNYTEPHQSSDFVLPSLVRQLAKIGAGEREPIIRLCNLKSVRDFSDTDVVESYRLPLLRGRSGKRTILV